MRDVPLRRVASLAFAAGVLGALVALSEVRAADGPLTMSASGRNGTRLDALVDGNAITLRAQLAAPAPVDTQIVFHLDGTSAPVGRCTIAAAAIHCDTPAFRTLGWAWGQGEKPGTTRTLIAVAASGRLRTSLDIAITPRPVILVHGFLSTAATWLAYSGRNGFLASIGVEGYAVGDERAGGVMNTGDIGRPAGSTATLQENAASLARYIGEVRARTGAEMVDIVAHSMGGLIARFYIARLMPQRDVAQLLMMGPPHGGSDCSGLPSALGLYGPASLELRPAYLRQIFNPAITQRHGVPFHILAGNAIIEGFKAPCTDVPSDMVVAQDSASAVPGVVTTLPVLHTDMTASEDVFRHFVRPHLLRGPGEFPEADDPEVSAEAIVPAQFTQVSAGRVPAGGSVDVEVNLDAVSIASFALFDPSRSLDVTIRGASGNVITLTAREHGLIRVDDPATMVHLGYGFAHPKPGPWRVTLRAARDLGADYALSARVVGGATLRAGASALTPRAGQAVTLSASLELPGATLSDMSMEAIVHQPDGRSQRLPLRRSEAGMATQWRPSRPGIHGVDIVARARTGAVRIERTAFLAVDVLPR